MNPWGLADDRRWMVTSPDGKFITQRTHPLLSTIEARPTAEGLHLTAAAEDRSEPLRTLSAYRRTRDGAMFGINLIPEGPLPAIRPIIQVGDAIEVLERGMPPEFLPQRLA